MYVCIYTRTLCVCSPTESEGGYTSLPRTSLSQDSGFDLMPPPRPVLESTVSLDSSQAAMAEGREEADGSGMSRSLDRRLLWVVADVRVRMCIIHICNNNTVHCNYMCIHIRTSCFGNLIIMYMYMYIHILCKWVECQLGKLEIADLYLLGWPLSCQLIDMYMYMCRCTWVCLLYIVHFWES